METQQRRELKRGSVHDYLDTKAKCRHKKKLTCKGPWRQVFLRIITGDSVGYVGIFDPFPCVKKYTGTKTVPYTYTVKGADNTCSQNSMRTCTVAI